MRVAAIYDVHGNLPALEAVLKDIKQVSPDLVLVGGDLVLGPMPRECLERLQSLERPVEFIRGNTDREISERPPEEPSPRPDFEAMRSWAVSALDPAQVALLAGGPLSVSHDIEGIGATLFCHATPRSDEEIITRRTPEVRVRAALQGVNESNVICGHVHIQYERRVDDHRIVNAGSVGMPYADAPGARWLVLGPAIDFRHTSYDYGAAAAVIRATGFPVAEGYVNKHVFAAGNADEFEIRLEETSAKQGKPTAAASAPGAPVA